MKNFKKLLLLAFALVVAATMGVSTSAEAARSFTGVNVTNTVTVRPVAQNITLAQWKKATLKTTSRPSVKPTFKTSNKAVATVDTKGVITARKPGVAKIYVTFAKNGYTKVTKTVVVRVKAGKVTKIALGTGSVAVGGKKTVYSRVYVSKTDANKELKWGSLNPDIAKVDAKTGEITGVKKGTATIVAKATDGTGVVGRTTVTVMNKITSLGLKAGYPTKMYVGKTYYNFTTMTNSDAFDGLANLIVGGTTSNKACASVVRRGKGNNYTVQALKKGTLVLYVRSNSKNPDGKYKYSKNIEIEIVDENVVKVEPKAETTATATVTGNPKAIAKDLEEALAVTGAGKNEITVTIDGVEKTVTYDGKKVMVGNTWLGDVETKTGKIGVTITENFASYVKDMDIFAAFMDGKEYTYTVKVGNHDFTSLKSDSGIYVVATVDGKEFKMYNVEKTLYIVGTTDDLGDKLVEDLSKVATLTDVKQ